MNITIGKIVRICSNKTWKIDSNTNSFFLKLALTYLLIPYVIFFAGWLRLGFAILLIGLLVTTYILVWRQINRDKAKLLTYGDVKLSHLTFAFLLLLIWLFFSGVGHFAYQFNDYLKHNLILTQLIHLDWPIIQHLSVKSANILIYYFAYYLPAGLFGRLFGFNAANIFLFFFTYLGLVIALYFVFSVTNKKYIILVCIMFIFFGGMDVLSGLAPFRLISSPSGIDLPLRAPLNYEGTSELLFNVPQQAIAAWIITSLLIWSILKKSCQKYLIFFWALTIFWTPWCFIGSFPILLYAIWKNQIQFKDYLTIPNILTSGIVIAIIMYFFSINRNSVGEGRWIWNSPFPWVGNYIIFIVLEFFIIGLLLVLYNITNKALIHLVVFTNAFLMLIPLFQSGSFNDFCTRVSIPLLTTIAIIAIYSVVDLPIKIKQGRPPYTLILITIILMVGASNGMGIIVESIQRTYSIHGRYFYLYTVEYEDNLAKSFDSILQTEKLEQQYLAQRVDYRNLQWLLKY